MNPKTIVHALIFLLAVIVFWVGLGAGLQFSPTVGSALWIAAAVIFVLNLLWMRRTRKR